jgi:Zn-dependent protease
MDFKQILLLAPPILLALTFHEFSHAYVAYRFGDDTAKRSGRLTMNPLAHLDPLGTIMIFIVHFGWAKPVPVNPYNLRNPKQGMLWISAAGPLSNILLALTSGLLIRFVSAMEIRPIPNSMPEIFIIMLVLSLKINLALAIFNILPIAPLDGSKILYGILPARFGKHIHLLERYGPILLIGLIISSQFLGVSILGRLIWPFVTFFSELFAGI